MHIMKIKTLALLIGIAAAVTLTACAEAAPAETAITETTAVETATAETTPTETSIAETTTAETTTAVTTTAETTVAETTTAEITTVETTTAMTTTAEITTAMTTTARTTTSVTTTAETTTAMPETTPVTTTTAAPFTLSPEAEQRLGDFDIDAEERETLYGKLDSRSDLPIIHVSTKDNAEILSLKKYTECLVDVFGCDEEYKIEAATAGIRIRGNSTAYYGDENQVRRNQVPYRIKFETKTNMLGLNDGAECKNWVFLKSNWNLIMDYTAFNLADIIMADDYYHSDCTFVHVYVNQKFAGVYLLTEQNQVNKNRVDITEPEENYEGTDIGYFVEIDNYADPEDKPCFNVDYLEAEVTDVQNVTRKFEPADYSIDSDVYSDEQKEFIADYVNKVFKIVYEATQKDNLLTFDENMELVDANDLFDGPYEAINAVMDVKSVVDMYILYEICHDYDCGEGSFYMAVDFAEGAKMNRLTFTAPWDFNWAYNDSATRVYYAGAFNDMRFVDKYGDRTNPWFVLMMTEDWFKALVSEKWADCYGMGEITDLLGEISDYLDLYADDLTRTDEWGVDSAKELLDWVTKRTRWLNSEFKAE